MYSLQVEKKAAEHKMHSQQGSTYGMHQFCTGVCRPIWLLLVLNASMQMQCTKDTPDHRFQGFSLALLQVVTDVVENASCKPLHPRDGLC